MKKYSILFILFIIFLNLILFTINPSGNTNISFIYPTTYTNISSEYGNRILNGYSNFHNGIDFLAPQGSEVYASNDGYISYASFLETGYGNTIIISHDNNIKTLYCHLSENYIVEIGQYVRQGELIGYVGPKYLSNGLLNGNTTGPHLHFTVFKNNSTINPFEIL